MRVIGTVVEAESGRPLEGLRVRAFDKDLIFDEKLGDTLTDADGKFKILYTEAQFRDFNETLPDLYIRIYDGSGKKLLFTWEKTVRRIGHPSGAFCTTGKYHLCQLGRLGARSGTISSFPADPGRAEPPVPTGRPFRGRAGPIPIIPCARRVSRADRSGVLV